MMDGLDARKCTLHIKQWPRRYEQYKSNRVHARIQKFLSGGGGGGGVEARRPENSLDNVFLVINLFYSLQSGSNGLLQRGGGGPNSSRGWGCPTKPI